MRASKITTILGLAALLVLGLTACQPPQESQPETAAEEPTGERVENATVGIALGALPAFFELTSNDDTIELAPAAAEDPARLTVKAGPAEVGGINLVAAVEEHKADLAARPDGVFKGQRELSTPLGTAFYSRGQYTGETGTEEETVIFLVHPWQDRNLQLVYRYPAGEDSAARIQEQLFAVLEQLEVLATSGEGTESEAS